ncbi:MAG TPA: diguanylate cyclase [Solirubrobacteraceae bacterium]|nr:diguanylate cyclase [Solirubrobacteraceae bacterium]
MIRSRPVLAPAGAVIALALLVEAAVAVSGADGTARVIGDRWLYSGVELASLAVLAARIMRSRTDRLAWTLIWLGLLGWTVGDLIWSLWLDAMANPPTPSIADAFYLTMYPALAAGLILLMRARLHRVGLTQWLDGLIVGLTTAALTGALMLAPVLRAADSRWLQGLINIAYPVGDLGLLGIIAVAWSLAGGRPGRAWALLGLATILTAVTDVLYAYEVAVGSYHAGAIIDVLWPASMATFAFAAWVPARSQPAAVTHAVHRTVYATGIAMVTALGLLVVAAFGHVTPTVVVLATCSLVLAIVRATRTHLAGVRDLLRSEGEAMTDALTGLGNRRCLSAALATQLAAGSRCTIAFSDLDGFKRYNDTFGHAAGDVLLSRMANRLVEAVAGRGSVYRLGGDEFCMLLPGPVARQDPVLAAIASALHQPCSSFAVTASIGLAVFPDEAVTPAAALQLADDRMYAEKARTAGGIPARDVLMQLLSERAPILRQRVSSVGSLAGAVGRRLALDAETMDELLRAAELHDIGKLAIPDEILDKPGPLTAEEWRFMREHTAIGERILAAAPALRPVARLVRSSHERWDGGGYPDGLAAERIPLGARIIAVCDAYEAITSDRCYQPARSAQAALVELRRNAGTQFDPRVVTALCDVMAERDSGTPSLLPPSVHT